MATGLSFDHPHFPSAREKWPFSFSLGLPVATTIPAVATASISLGRLRACSEKEVLEVLLVGERRENLGKSGCGGWGRCPKVPVEGPWLVRVESAMSCCRILEMALCRGSAFPYRSIKIAVSRGV